jgi:hypothetical protein
MKLYRNDTTDSEIVELFVRAGAIAGRMPSHRLRASSVRARSLADIASLPILALLSVILNGALIDREPRSVGWVEISPPLMLPTVNYSRIGNGPTIDVQGMQKTSDFGIGIGESRR